MKRLARGAFDGVAALAAAIGVIALLAWGFGGPNGHTWHIAFDSHRAGAVSVQHNWEVQFSGRLAFEYQSKQWTRWDIHRLVIPYLAVVGLCAVLSAVWLRRPRPTRQRYRRSGVCPWCGYDLRASPERCPECGATPRGSSARA